jgi:hypothetical protein
MMTTATDKSNENTPNVELTSEKTTSDFVLDRSLFDQNIRLIAINIPAKLCTVYMKEFKDYLLKRPRMKRIYDIEKDGVKDEERRLVILNEDLGDNLLLPTLPQHLKDFNIKNNGIPEIFMLKVSYENIPVDEVLRKVLPEEIIEIPSSFEQVGHIAHLNLRDEVLKYKHLIGTYKHIYLNVSCPKFNEIKSFYITILLHFLQQIYELIYILYVITNSSSRISFCLPNIIILILQ